MRARTHTHRHIHFYIYIYVQSKVRGVVVLSAAHGRKSASEQRRRTTRNTRHSLKNQPFTVVSHEPHRVEHTRYQRNHQEKDLPVRNNQNNYDANYRVPHPHNPYVHLGVNHQAKRREDHQAYQGPEHGSDAISRPENRTLAKIILPRASPHFTARLKMSRRKHADIKPIDFTSKARIKKTNRDNAIIFRE